MHIRRYLIVASACALSAACSGGAEDVLLTALDARVARSGAAVVSVYFEDLQTGEQVAHDADVRMHAASTMKIPVMIQVFRDQDAGLLSLNDSVAITKTFRSIVDGSPYDLSAPDDSDTTLYRRLGERERLLTLAELMITVSSNLATNILIDLVGADRVQATMRELGADSIAVLRGVEDIKAYERGLSNTTTARDLGIMLAAIADGRTAGAGSTDMMLDIMLRQQFRDGIPARLPEGTRVASKDGWIEGITHDAGIVYLPDGRRYVLVVLTEGIESQHDARRVIADISRLFYDHMTAD